jgi:hypothetical protein
LSTYQKAALAKDQAESQLTNTELTLIKSVQRAFLALLKARADVKSNQDSVARLESQYKVTQAFYDVGLKPRLDVLQAEAELATAEQNLLKAQNTVLTQTAQLNSLLNLPLEQDTPYVGELSYTPFTMTIDQCLDTAYKTRPDLYIGVKSVQIAEKDAKVAASPLYPQIQAQAAYTRKGDTPNLDNNPNHLVVPSLTVGQRQLAGVGWGSTLFGTPGPGNRQKTPGRPGETGAWTWLALRGQNLPLTSRSGQTHLRARTASRPHRKANVWSVPLPPRWAPTPRCWMPSPGSAPPSST